jgi:hypothetical protein
MNTSELMAANTARLLQWTHNAMNRFGPSTVCPDCGNDLDGGEICECNEEEHSFQENMQNEDH